jgi:hypothetical protein
MVALVPLKAIGVPQTELALEIAEGGREGGRGGKCERRKGGREGGRDGLGEGREGGREGGRGGIGLEWEEPTQ